MGFGDTFQFFAYFSDNGNTYSVKLSTADGAAGGFTPLSGALSAPAWPWNSSDLRHITGKTAGGVHGSLKVAANSDARYVSGGSWTDGHGRTFQVLGAIGERRPASHIGD